MDLGIMLATNQDLATGEPRPWSVIAQHAALAEEAGFASVVVPDHLLWQLPSGPRGFLEHVTVLGALAATTSRVRIGSSVMCSSFRSPGLAAKIADTVQDVAGGRYVLGLGAGGPRGEYVAFGYPTDHLASRFAEYVEIVATLLREGSATFTGRFHWVQDAVMTPRPASGPSPLLIAAQGERTMAVAARFADEWNWFTLDDPGAAYFAPLLERLDAACAAVGRDPATLRRSVDVLAGVDPPPDAVEALAAFGMTAITGSLDEVAVRLAEIAALGVAEARLYPLRGEAKYIESLAPLVGLLG